MEIVARKEGVTVEKKGFCVDFIMFVEGALVSISILQPVYGDVVIGQGKYLLPTRNLV